MKINVKELKDINEIRRYMYKASEALFTAEEDLMFDETVEYDEKQQRIGDLKNTILELRKRLYEISSPVFSDGTLDLYCDYGTHFSICEFGKIIPIGTIEYTNTSNPIPGNISYEIKKEYRGHNYALRALRMVGKQLLDEGITSITITAPNNTNYPSIKTIERFGGIMNSNWSLEDSGPIPYTCDLKRIYSK